MERFQHRIQQWVELDNKIKTLNDEIREIRTERNNVSDEIVAFVDENNLDKAVIEISDGALKFGKPNIMRVCLAHPKNFVFFMMLMYLI